MKDIKDYFNSSGENVDAPFPIITSKNDRVNLNSERNKCKNVMSSTSGVKSETKKNSKSESNENIKQYQGNFEKNSKIGQRSQELSSFVDAVETKVPIYNIKNSRENLHLEGKQLVLIKDSNPEKTKKNIEMEELSQVNQSNSNELNAFQFLMNSRSKVIGTNSPGKELPDKEEHAVVTEANNEKLAIRKNLLQNWANSKKEKKRKLDEEEIDKCIKEKLETRKKRFKSLLKNKNINEMGKKVIDSSVSLIESKTRRQTSLTKFGITSVDSSLSENDCTLITSLNNEGSLHDISKSLDEGEHMEKLNNSVSSGNDFEEKRNTQFAKKKKHKHKKKLESNGVIHNSPIQKPLRHWKIRIKLRDDEEQDIDEDNMKATSENFIERAIDTKNEDITLITNYKRQSHDENVVDIDNHEKGSIKKCVKTNANKYQAKIEKASSVEDSEPKSEALLEGNVYKRILRERTSIHKPKKYTCEEISSNESSNESFKDGIKKRKAVKVAPIFAKAIPKPQVDPEVIKARRQFLLSEIPDQFNNSVERKASVVIPEFDVFPKVSHIQQINPEEFCSHLSEVNLPMRNKGTFEYKVEDLTCKSLINMRTIQKSSYKKSEPIKNVQNILKNMKLDNPDYPVHRSFRLLQQKSGNNFEFNKSSGEIISSKHSPTSKEDTKSMNELSLSKQMWIEKYKPNSSEDIIGNFQAVSCLKKWLESWHEAFKNGKNKIRSKLYSSDSESDFLSSDGESLVGSSSLSSTVILTGPCGSGKSSSVYAICNELGINVIELNASSKRSGKQVLQEIQEATQSHQVRKKKESIIAIKEKKRGPKHENKEHDVRKMCVVLIEDVDIVFEQDEGLINAISQISSVTKRPIVLTTTNVKFNCSQKFMKDFKNIQFTCLTAEDISIWLQILCLIEGYFVDVSSIGEFVEYNKGDMRKTLMGLQFWIQSGGQINKNKQLFDKFFQIHCQHQLSTDNKDVLITQRDDNTSNISLKEQEGKIDIFRTHTNLVSDFEIFQLDTFYDVPLNFDLLKIWWNIPVFLNIQTEYENRFNPRKKSKRNKVKLQMISDMFDSLASCDVAYRRVSFKCDVPVCYKRWNNYLYDSLEIGEVLDEYSSDPQLFFEWNHYLVNGNLNRCKERFLLPPSKYQRVLNMALPRVEHKRMLVRSNACEEELLNPVPLFCHLDRKSVSLDYLPSLRNIARSEKNRAQNNVRRNNRFYNYLQTLNIKCNSSVLSVATDSLLVDR